MSQKAIITVLVLITLSLGGVYLLQSSGGSDADSAASSDFDRFADVTVTDYEGDKVKLEKFRGQPLVINSWATWCAFCLAELPDFGRLQTAYGDEVKVLAINRGENPEGVKSYTDEVGVTDELLFLLDDKDSFYQSIGGFAMPETVFIDASGEIVVHKRGPMELGEMQEHTEKIVNTN